TLLAMYEQPPTQRGAQSTVSIAAERPLQIALAFDGTSQTMRLFLDGERIAERNVGIPLSALNDVNAWLGRSQWTQDRFARARYDEFRLYDVALGDEEILRTFTRGPSSP
ncbi:MAG: LamG-like jellyroll fold domain-containing protein, partial [Polyangiales bacterium]